MRQVSADKTGYVNVNQIKKNLILYCLLHIIHPLFPHNEVEMKWMLFELAFPGYMYHVPCVVLLPTEIDLNDDISQI